jgi:hypothetical protein
MRAADKTRLTPNMGFSIGQIYQCAEVGSREAIVSEVRSDGREGLLRFTDTGTEEWFVWDELSQAGKWRLKNA